MRLYSDVETPVETHRRVVYAGCPLCSATETELTGVADCTQHALYDQALPPEMRWLTCKSCSHVFTDGYFDRAALDVLFSRTHANQTPGSDVERQRFASADLIDWVVQSTGKTAGAWLDVGFGSGSLLTTAEEYGFDATGIDLRESSVRLLAECGFDVHCTSLEAFFDEHRFDIISMCDVLEHVPYPGKTLDAARKRLAQGGVLFISMPNAGSFVWQSLEATKSNPYWAEIEHYHNFTSDRLERLLAEYGFKIMRYGVSRRYRACMDVLAVAT